MQNYAIKSPRNGDFSPDETERQIYFDDEQRKRIQFRNLKPQENLLNDDNGNNKNVENNGH
ncbi:hypothetical protein OA86_08605 [Kaistella jeonii]|uniref:Uncharacterized protein n=1 Tax=Kaistella jeonii TaxID=266749 RepID=A0A0C1F7H0_9FLAO|nr:hypothetical protein OA86_08605 [Kaistella jeonii]